MIRIKICGITNKEDALMAAEAGADALGFILYPKSPRFVEPDRVAEIISALPPFVTPVGVFVDEEDQEIRRILRRCGLRILQFHGNESPAFCRSFREKAIKAFRVGETRNENGNTLRERMQNYTVDACLLDTYTRDLPGGTGNTFDWGIAAEVRAALQNSPSCSKRIILSGGLTPDNVAEAIRKVGPYAVDVSSGVESAPGKKDAEKVKAFIRAVRNIESV